MNLLREIGFMDNSFDYAISSFMSKFHGSFFDGIMDMITHLGDNGIFWIILAVVLLYFKKTRRTGMIMGISLIFCLLVNNILIKNVVGRNRPFMEHKEFYDLVYSVLVPPTSGSFVSGHSAASFAGATALFMMYRKKKMMLWLPASILAFLIAFSRVYLLVHYFTDVIGGCILGIGLGVGAYYFMKLIDLIYFRVKKEEVKELFVYND